MLKLSLKCRNLKVFLIQHLPSAAAATNTVHLFPVGQNLSCLDRFCCLTLVDYGCNGLLPCVNG